MKYVYQYSFKKYLQKISNVLLSPSSFLDILNNSTAGYGNGQWFRRRRQSWVIKKRFVCYTVVVLLIHADVILV